MNELVNIRVGDSGVWKLLYNKETDEYVIEIYHVWLIAGNEKIVKIMDVHFAREHILNLLNIIKDTVLSYSENKE